MRWSSSRWPPRAVVAATVLAWAGCHGSQPVAVLPAIAEVRSVTAHSFDPEAGLSFAFDVPLDRLPAIYSALQPATVDAEPRDWVILGELEMTLRDGRPFRVDLYNVRPDGEGAFSAGEAYEGRTYYRGGSSTQLVEAMREAREAAFRAGTPMQPRGEPR